jgi:23S rRNA (pseudouridine1915-N3)-methyltransferase
MFKIKVYTIGKLKETWLEKILAEYTKRLCTSLTIEWNLAKNQSQLDMFLEKETHYICLDPKGHQLTSLAFSQFLFQNLEINGSRLSFIIGGAEGLSSKIKGKASQVISLSLLTFTHQMTRLILVEQLYRAVEIEKGTQYHK